MNLEELKDQWQSQNDKLTEGIRLNRALLHETVTDKVAGALSRSTRPVWIELFLNGVVLVVLGSFIAKHLHEPRFLLPAIALHLFTFSLIISGIRQLAIVSQIDFDAPVLESQKALERLRIEKIRTTKWTFLLAPLLWTPLLIVGLKGVFRIDAYANFPVAWLWGNVLFGVAFLAIMLWISKRFASLGRSGFIRRLMDDIAGRSLAAAQEHLARLSRFENESEETALA